MDLGVMFLAAGALLSGRWEGAAQIPGREVRLIIDLAQDDRDRWIGSAILPGFGVKGAALKDVVVGDASVAFAITGALGVPTLKGLLAPDGTLSGDFQQGGNTARFVLRRVGPPQVEPPRTSTRVRADFEGPWQGETALMGNPIRARLTLANRPGGAASAEFMIVGRKEHNLAVDLVTQEGDLLTVEAHEGGATFIFEGRLHAGANEVKGALLEGPIEAPLILSRAPAPAPQP
ncbi:MAG: hypothetical protein ACHQNV_08665 [Vicinamibacteria bacterium]